MAKNHRAVRNHLARSFNADFDIDTNKNLKRLLCDCGKSSTIREEVIIKASRTVLLYKTPDDDLWFAPVRDTTKNKIIRYNCSCCRKRLRGLEMLVQASPTKGIKWRVKKDKECVV